MNGLVNLTWNDNSIWTKILIKPLFNILLLFYVLIPGSDLGLAIIAITLLVRIVLFPSYFKTIKAQRMLQKHQPELDKIRERYKHDKEVQAKEVMKFYQENKVNPLSGCLPLLVQLPILFALYRVFSFALDESALTHLYNFFPLTIPESINPIFLSWSGISWLMVDLSERSIALALIAAVSQYFQAKMMTPPKAEKDGEKPQQMAQMLTGQMMYIFPVITFFFAMSLPSALALYWVATTLFTILQQVIVKKIVDKPQKGDGQRDTIEGESTGNLL